MEQIASLLSCGVSSASTPPKHAAQVTGVMLP